MKASLKFREEQRPLVRTKIPISILGLPFLSGVSAGEARELRLDLATAFDAGPSLRLSYRPNDPSNPFSLVLKTGIGALGSPTAAPMSMSAEFNLIGRTNVAGSGPIFSILFKPRFGDFSIRKTTRSLAPAAPSPVVKKIAVEPDTDGEGSVEGAEAPSIGFRPVNGKGIHPGWKVNGIAADGPTAGIGGVHGLLSGIGGIHGLLSGIEISARSVLPLRSRAAVRFRWGLRVPPEIRTAFAEDGGGRISLSKLPLLVMSKISIEHVAAKSEKAKEKKADGSASSAVEVAETCISVKRQLEAMQADNGLLRKAVEELRSEVAGGGGKASPASRKTLSGGADVGNGVGKPPAAGKRDRRNDVKSPEFTGKATSEDVSEELKKALMGATGAGI